MTAAVEIAPIDAQTAYDLLAAAVEIAGPDHVYRLPEGTSSCKYVDGDNPSCIVGVALAIHGVPLDVLREWDAGVTHGSAIGAVFSHGDGARLFDAGAQQVFSAAQQRQDDILGGFTWGDALEAAAARLAELT